jgi:hypothetical protein
VLDEVAGGEGLDLLHFRSRRRGSSSRASA